MICFIWQEQTMQCGILGSRKCDNFEPTLSRHGTSARTQAPTVLLGPADAQGASPGSRRTAKPGILSWAKATAEDNGSLTFRGGESSYRRVCGWTQLIWRVSAQSELACEKRAHQTAPEVQDSSSCHQWKWTRGLCKRILQNLRFVHK